MDCRLNQLLVFVNRIGRHDKSTIVLLLLFHISSFNLFLKIYLIIVSSRFLPFFFLKIYANLLFFYCTWKCWFYYANVYMRYIASVDENGTRAWNTSFSVAGPRV